MSQPRIKSNAKASPRGSNAGLSAVGAKWIAYWPTAAAVLALGYLASQARTPVETGPMRVHEFGRIPIVYQGRIKPIDTLARNTLMIISDRQTYVDEAGKRRPAVAFLLDILARTGDGEKHKVFRIDNEQVLGLLGLEERPGFRYAIDEFADKVPEIAKQATRAQQLDNDQRDIFDAKIIELAQQLDIYVRLSKLEIPHVIPPQSITEDWQTYAQLQYQLHDATIRRMRAALARSGFDPASAGQEQLMQKLKSDESFRTLLQTEFDKARTELNPAMRSWDAMLTAYSDGDASAFNAEVSTYLARLQGRFPDVLTKVNVEMLFNRVEPFYHCSVLYAAAFLLAAAGWLGWEKLLNRTALSVLAVTFVVHTGALIVRMYLQGRPPVTNLYSSAIFIGWGCVLLAMILEKLFRNGMGNVTAAVTGSLTLIVAHNLSGDGDTLEMMQAVLDTNFWLATHVTCITIGYASTFMAGFLGIMYILRGVLTTSLDEHARKAHSRMIYGIVCFATLFSFTGTVLGGIWADQSWGRFWGWDPKENGALLIVLWNALILHARWGGIVRERGMAVLAVLGNIVTAWSWFGTNMLGVGLHSYGFMTGAVFWLVVFVLTQLGISALGTLPVSLWRSFGASNPDDLRRAPLRAPATT